MSIIKKIDEGRRFFGIDDYPGNLFDVLNTKEMVYENRILVFRQDLDKLSGFIGYKSGFVMICINYKRNIGHQNFTLAHEIGHLFLHPGINKTDVNPESSEGDKIESEANLFASELIYPKILAKIDYEYAKQNKLFSEDNWDEFAEYINTLCEKYCTSFIFSFNKIGEYHFSSYRDKSKYYKKFKKYIGKFRDRFPAHIYEVDESHIYYQKNIEPYNYMILLIDKLIEAKELGFETGEAIKDRYLKLGE